MINVQTGDQMERREHARASHLVLHKSGASTERTYGRGVVYASQEMRKKATPSIALQPSDYPVGECPSDLL